MLSAIGFWSYTTADDRNARGKLTRLRALLAAELQQHIGRLPEVTIFQDIETIPAGGAWERQIRQALEKSSFILPIITPAFFQSEWCCRELEIFRDRENSLERDDLIFPIHWIDTSHIDPQVSHDCCNSEVFRFLRSRQWTDLCRFRLGTLETEELGATLSKLSLSVRAALRSPKGLTEPIRGEQSLRISNSQTASAREKLARAQVAFNRKDYVGARPLFQAAAELGNSVAAFYMGTLYQEGFGVPQDYSEAMRWFLKSADQGDPRGQNSVGWLYDNGRGVPRDHVEGVRWFRKAAEQGLDVAQFNVGESYEYGSGLPQDYGEALKWYRRAAEQGYGHAQYNIGVLYASGRGVPRNIKQARAWIKKAEASGYNDAGRWLDQHPEH
jgi:hypothetical protein